MNNITNMKEFAGDFYNMTGDELIDIIKSWRSKNTEGIGSVDKLLVIGLDTSDNDFSVCVTSCGMKNSEVIACCEIIKKTSIDSLGY